MRSLTINCRSIPIMDVRIRTPERRIANLMMKVSLTDRQLSSCEISSKSDCPFSQNRCVTYTQTDRQTHTHTHRHTGLQWWSKKTLLYYSPGLRAGGKNGVMRTQQKNFVESTKSKRSLAATFCWALHWQRLSVSKVTPPIWALLDSAI